MQSLGKDAAMDGNSAMAKIETMIEGRFIRLLRRGAWEFASRQKLAGIVAIMAATPDDKVLLVEQFRPPLNASVIELPAGLAGDAAGSEDEALLIAAQRELLEETGYEAEWWEESITGASSPGLTDECSTIFLAGGLRRVHAGGGVEGENITIHEIPFAEVDAWLAARLASGTQVANQVYAGLYLWLRHQGAKR